MRRWWCANARWGKASRKPPFRLRQTGIVAPLALDGPITGSPITGAAVRAYIEQFPAPALAPGDVVVPENLAAHKVAGVGRAIAARGTSFVYLPPYSPDLNSTEPLFGWSRSVATSSRRAE